VIVLENDLYRRAPADAVDELFARAKSVVALDHLANATTERAAVVLPAATFAESDGTFVNNEGRAQRFYQVFVPTEGLEIKPAQESWRWLHDISLAAERLPGGAWLSLDGVIASLVHEHPALQPVAEVAPPADFRIAGQRVARQLRRYTGRTATLANLTVHEPKPPEDPDSPLSYSMEGFAGQPPSPLITQFWSPGWNSNQALNKFQDEIAGPLKGGDPGKRLLEPPAGLADSPRYFGESTPLAGPEAGQLLAVPLYHIFGSEELSVLTTGIAELAPAPYLGLNAADAARLGLSGKDLLEIGLGGRLRRLEVRIVPSLPAGVAGLPVGLPDLAGVDLPATLDLGQAEGRRSV
jgi:NADH-quinone oxidoreductase subunit G